MECFSTWSIFLHSPSLCRWALLAKANSFVLVELTRQAQLRWYIFHCCLGSQKTFFPQLGNTSHPIIFLSFTFLNACHLWTVALTFYLFILPYKSPNYHLTHLSPTWCSRICRSHKFATVEKLSEKTRLS